LAENVSVFAGARGVLANCNYTGSISNIKTAGQLTGGQTVSGSDYLNKVAAYMTSIGQTEAATTAATGAALMSQDLVLDCSQSGFGITPIIGIDWNLGKLNLAAKYEFRTKIELENDSKNTSKGVTTLMPAYADGAKNRSDIPALLTLGAQYEIADNFRAMIGGVYYWDKDAKGTPIKKGDNTWEANFGVEWDMNDKVMLSFGGQRTQFGFDDSDMSDTNFFTGCSSLAIGGAYKFSEKMKLNVGYMHSFYDNHKFTNVNGTACDYTRKNDAVGVSLDIRF
jgi:long-subunit fatty acid transport protein